MKKPAFLPSGFWFGFVVILSRFGKTTNSKAISQPKKAGLVLRH